jgi:hypothetical protein
MEGARQGLVGLPDCAQAAIANFCGRAGHIMIMSTCSGLLRAFAVHVEEVALTNSNYRSIQRGRTNHSFKTKRTSGLDPATAVPALLRRLPNLRLLHCCTEDGRVGLLGALAQALTAGGGCCARVVELELRGEPPRHEVEALAQAIGMGTLPSLETLRVGYGSEDLLLVCEALRGGASPRLASLEVALKSEDLVALGGCWGLAWGLGAAPSLASSSGGKKSIRRRFRGRRMRRTGVGSLCRAPHSASSSTCERAIARCAACRDTHAHTLRHQLISGCAF